jgi:polyhydroxyalkanoate synthase
VLGDVTQRLNREIDRTAFRLRNGIKHFRGVDQAEVGPSPRRLIWSRDKVRLYRYASPAQQQSRARPLLLVMSLVTTPLVFDLQSGNSLVERLVDDGHTVYLIDWGIPDEIEAFNTLQTYCDDYIPRAVGAVVDDAHCVDVTLFGYCLGAVFSLLSVAAHPGIRVADLVLLATPVDFTRMDPLSNILRNERLEVDDLLDETGNLPSSTMLEAFRMVEPAGEVVTYLNLWNSFSDPDRLAAHQALIRWSSGHIPFPGNVLRQIVDLFIRDDALVRGVVPLDAREIDLHTITRPVLSVLGSNDRLVPPASSAPLPEVLSSAQLKTIELTAGHAGLFVGRKAHNKLIPAILEWLDTSNPRTPSSERSNHADA